MKIGDRVWIRIGLDRFPVQGTLIAIDLAGDTGEVWIDGRRLQRSLKRIHANRPTSQRDRRQLPVVGLGIFKRIDE